MTSLWRRRRPTAPDRLIRFPEHTAGLDVDVVKERDELRGLVDEALDALQRSPYFCGRRPVELVQAVEKLVTAHREVSRSHGHIAVELATESRRTETLRVENAQLHAQVAALRNHTSSDEAKRWKRMWEQDRRNLVAMEDRLARVEGRRTSSAYPGGS